MALNLIKRKVKIQKVPRSYTKVDRFYIVWNREDTEYFLSDANLDGTELLWHTNKSHGVNFEDGKKALEFCLAVKDTRSGPGIIELKIVTEHVRGDDDATWTI